MRTTIQERPRGWQAWYSRRTRVGRVSLWLFAVLMLCLLARILGILRGLDTAVIVLCGLALVPLVLILLYRWITRRVLWKVRNRLILTYLLMGLAPVVLFGALSCIAAYLFAGQYATATALAMLEDASIQARDETVSEALSLQQQASGSAASKRAIAVADSHVTVSALEGSTWHILAAPVANGTMEASPLAATAPSWMNAPFRGTVAIDGHLYLCSETSVRVGARSVLVLGTMPFDEEELSKMAKGFGTITLLPGFSKLANDSDNINVNIEQPSTHSRGDNKSTNGTIEPIKGGVLSPRTHFFDTPVYFTAMPAVSSWETGKPLQTLMVVVSRPTLLYAHLFSTSTDLGAVVWGILIGIAIVFSVLELIALLMAAGLSRTITHSVADLYRGTREIDAGNLEHRVRVARNDQLGALASSFNGMAASIGDLLVQQREKARLLNELAIAQEVQTTLFPKSPAYLSGLEIHALSLPARTVGGDYFDFIFAAETGTPGKGVPGKGLCLALGDISGKGISAALLMASLHSAIRTLIADRSVDEKAAASPALLLKLLNRHLFSTTQVARYATLFLAFYDVESQKLTYANGGHPPPLVLSRDGSVRRLDAGGSVVGLLDGLEYAEATVHLATGDLLIAFTDGLTEPENEAGEFGEERLLEQIEQNRQLPLPDLAAATLETLREWIGQQEQPDDMTILLARQI